MTRVLSDPKRWSNREGWRRRLYYWPYWSWPKETRCSIELSPYAKGEWGIWAEFSMHGGEIKVGLGWFEARFHWLYVKDW